MEKEKEHKQQMRPPLPSSRFSEHSSRFMSLYDVIINDENTSSIDRAVVEERKDELMNNSDTVADEESHDGISERMSYLNQQLSRLSYKAHLYEYGSLPFMVRIASPASCHVMS